MPAENLFDQALKAEGVTGKLADLARSIYTQESGGGKNSKTSNRGAVGGMQILPSTFREVADNGWRIDDPEQNARAGIRYVAKMYKAAGGDPVLTGAGYYGGLGGMAKARQGVAVSDPVNPGAPNQLQYGAQVAARAGMGGSAPTMVAQASIPAPVAPAAVASAAPVLPVVQGDQAAQPMTVAVAAPAIAPVAEAPVDPWQEFLRQVPAQHQVTAQDLDFRPTTVAQVEAPQMGLPPAPRAVMPNFQAFSHWKGQAA